MTSIDRFDPFERRIAAAIEEIAEPRLPDYLDDAFQLTARTSQRPAWTFLERWLPVDSAAIRPTLVGRIPIRPLVILALLAALIAATLAAWAGSQRRVPSPFGPAANGSIAYAANGDLYVRDTLTGEGHMLFAGEGTEFGPAYAPDGTYLTFVSTRSDGDHFMVARDDGTAVRELALIPPSGNAQAAWSPDSRSVALIYDVESKPQLTIAGVDGSSRAIDLGKLRPLDVAWSPPSGARLLIRAEMVSKGTVDLYTLRPDGSDLQPFGLPGTSAFGTVYTNSGPTWAPDGRTIAFNAIEDNPGSAYGGDFRVALVNADGTPLPALPGPTIEKVQEGWPAFSPDGSQILVHRWVFKPDSPTAEGWLAVMPADGSAPAHDIGPRIPGGEDTGLTKAWSPDGSRVLMRAGNTKQVYSINPVDGTYELLPWTTDLPDWQRVSR